MASATDHLYSSSLPQPVGLFLLLLLLSFAGCFGDGSSQNSTTSFPITGYQNNSDLATWATTANHHEWRYEEKDLWPIEYESCHGHHQSPIAINTSTTIRANSSRIFKFDKGYYNTNISALVINNGHTAQVTISGNASFKGGVLPLGDYKFVQLHFHWGGNDSIGSEHILNGRRFPLELHLVHYHQNYSNFNDALNKKGAIVVLGVWFENTGNGSKFTNKVLQPLVKTFGQIKSKGDTVRVPGFKALYDLLPEDRSAYFYYEGSFTTPECNENVLWIVFKNRLTINHEQLEAFRNLKEERAGAPVMHQLENNFRPPQPLYDRKVYYIGAATYLQPNAYFILFQLTMAVFICAKT